ncbi:MAG TPA: OmpH family outer membrane protein [Opitutaceae bacterium]|nr:OmpH family outer membrane protein [Opitutaceae bacterium]
MKNPIRTLCALVAFGAATLAAQAEPTFKLLMVDMAKLYDTHYKTIDQNAKLQADDQKAQEEVAKMNTEGNALVEQYKGLKEQSSNPALTAEAKAKAENDAQRILESIQGKQNEVRTFVQNTQRSLQQRLQNFRSLMLEEIGKVASDVARRKGGTLLLDKAGPTLIGVSSVVYFDPAYDITEEVAKEINKDKPAGMPSGTVTPGSPTVVPSGDSGTPKLTVPGVSPKK